MSDHSGSGHSGSRKKHCLQDAALQIGMNQEILIEFIHRDWICPAPDPDQLQQDSLLDEEDLARIRLILELREELGANDEAIPIILHLIDQLNRLQLEIRRRAG